MPASESETILSFRSEANTRQTPHMPAYAQVIVPKPLDGTFTYAVPENMLPMVKPGHRVLVPFGGKRLYTGIVESVSDSKTDG
ncbi:MAG: hypothetical protein K2I56_09345, partial [Muribaculaceae bacterium]|nr:hypothetical protein [Muribaculaceae bacterium]